MDLDYNRPEVGQATNDANRVFSGIFDKIGLGARFPSKLDKVFEAAGLVNVSIRNVDLPMGKRLGDDKAAQDSWEPFAITVPSVVETAKCKLISSRTFVQFLTRYSIGGRYSRFCLRQSGRKV
jgi:hypothetical protein